MTKTKAKACTTCTCTYACSHSKTLLILTRRYPRWTMINSDLESQSWCNARRGRKHLEFRENKKKIYLPNKILLHYIHWNIHFDLQTSNIRFHYSLKSGYHRWHNTSWYQSRYFGRLLTLLRHLVQCHQPATPRRSMNEYYLYVTTQGFELALPIFCAPWSVRINETGIFSPAASNCKKANKQKIQASEQSK